ncbi:MAG TPA: STAS domain-containing protein [Streptosporangiaceae bacterium]
MSKSFRKPCTATKRQRDSSAAQAQGGDQTTADHGNRIQILRLPAELDLATADEVVGQGYAALARSARLLLLDLTDTSFCDARGLSVFTRIANRAEATGCRYGLIGLQPPVARVLRIVGLEARLPVFASLGDALAHIAASAPGCGAA